MESPKTKILLEKYWAGNSTSVEELQLKAQFKDNIPKEAEKYGVLFDYATNLKQQETTFDLDFLDEVVEQKSSLRKVNWYKWPASIAASLLIVFLSISYQWKGIEIVTAQTTSTNTAYEETLYALAFLSEKLNKGNASIYELSSFDKTKKQIINEN